MKNERAERLHGASMSYAPTNELGVVFLFAEYARRKRLHIEEIRPGFPDCIATQKVQGGERRIRIEFEFKSRSFETHRHRARACDWIVCWEHNWPGAPKHLQIIELRREFGLGFNVWIVPVRGSEYKDELRRCRKNTWSVPTQAHEGDLVLFYLTMPEKHIKHVFVLKDRAKVQKAYWKPGMDCMAPIKKVVDLKAPILLEQMRRNRILKHSHFIRFMQGKHNATEYWPWLYDLIVDMNPTAKRALQKYAPENLSWLAY